MNRLRKELCAESLFALVRKAFDTIKDPAVRRSEFSLTDCLMSGLAIFSLKYPSLLQFDQTQQEERTRHNLRTLYGVLKTPSDTSLRERLDPISPKVLSKSFNKVFAVLQRGKGLEGMEFYKDHYLVPLDGTGFFSSHEIHCESCCEKHHRDGQTTYYHQILSAVLVHPDHRAVFPFAPEPILKQDGSKKNDCERNAAQRLLSRLRTEHPHLKIVIGGDGLYGNGPFIKLLQHLHMRYILTVKPKDHAYLFEFFQVAKKDSCTIRDKKNLIHHYTFVNGLPLNDTHDQLLVNMIDYTEEKPDGKIQHFTWVTDFEITEQNVQQLVKGGRARWKIENETFNTLKNQGYQFEHNFGHGYQHLSTVFAYLMMLAFLIDQVQQHCCQLFQAALAKRQTRARLWEKMRGLTSHYLVNSWQDLFESIIYGHNKDCFLAPDTS